MEFRVVKSKRKTLCLSVEASGIVLVRAPLSVSEKEIGDFVHRHERWIASRLAKRKKRRTLSFSDGERLVLFGESYEIVQGKPKIGSGQIALPVNGRGIAFTEMVKRLAEEYMTAVVSEIASRFGFVYSRIRISPARTRWGSCSKAGTLSFTCFLAFVDPALAYYVAVHELCHTRCFNHGKEFWREVERVLPDWRVRRAKLRKEEDCLDFLR